MLTSNGNNGYMYKQSWDRPTYFEHDASSDRSLSSGMTSGVGGGAVLAEFEVDYLVSFVAGPRQRAHTIDEGVSELHQRANTSGLWTMRCMLAVTAKELIVIQRQTREEVERFPLALMQQITPRESRDPKEAFNNIFIFTIVEEKGLPEMHIFQVLMTPASALAEEVRRIKDGRANPPMPGLVGNGRWTGAHVSSSDGHEAGATGHLRGGPQAVTPRRTSKGGSDAGLSDSSELERAEREVYLLNRCFDDIERFVGRIHQSVDAYKELQRRQNQRRKKDKKHGDGLLTMRARLPPLEDFVDCFKKFKLSFNLLARLQDFIHNPNASELVHFLFTPLALVCDCSPEPPGGPPNEVLARRVVSPLLSLEAVSLLRHCLISKESDLWRRLGDAWTTPRNKWTGYVPPYVPRFWDGYQPAPSDYEEVVGAPAGDRVDLDDGSAVNAISQVVAEQANLQRRKDEAERARIEVGGRRASEAEQSVLPFPRKSDDPFGARAVGRPSSNSSGLSPSVSSPPPPTTGVPVVPDPRVNAFKSHVTTHLDRNKRVNSGSTGQSSPRLSNDAIDGPAGLMGPPNWAQRQELFCADVMGRGGRVYRTLCDKIGKNNKELTVQRGELLEVLDDSRNWWKMRNADGEVGHIPYTLLKQHDVGESDDRPEHVNGDSKLAHSTPPASAGPTNRHSWLGSSNSVVPPPPPPPPAPPLIDPYTASGNVARRKDDKKDEVKRRPQSEITKPGPDRILKMRSHPVPEHAEDLTNELKQKISLGPVQPKVIKRPKSVNINQESKPAVVTEWLRLKGFTERTISILSGKDGAGLFRMKRYEMDKQLSREEASRLDSLLTVQKNICGYGTRSSLELRAILRKRKEQSESFVDGDASGPDQQITDEVF